MAPLLNSQHRSAACWMHPGAARRTALQMGSLAVDLPAALCRSEALAQNKFGLGLPYVARGASAGLRSRPRCPTTTLVLRQDTRAHPFHVF